MPKTVQNYIDGKFVPSAAVKTLEIVNPSNLDLLGRTPLGGEKDLHLAVHAAKSAFPGWRDMPVTDRIQFFFKLKNLLEKKYEEIGTIIVKEHGKTYKEALGDIRRGIQMVETACGMPNLLMGDYKDNIATGIDSVTIRRPLGVFAAITPFNFPAMVPFWFWPFAVAAGNTFIVKPSEYVPLTQMRIFELIDEAGFPKGVINLVHGGKEMVNSILANHYIRGISFVGSTLVAKHIHKTGSASGKRVQALGGAKNSLVLMPDAVMGKSVAAMVDSCFGCAGERCLAGSILIAVGDAYGKMKKLVVEEVNKIVVGDGLDPKTTMGPVITAEAKKRILSDMELGIKQGATLVVDGRNKNVKGLNGHFLFPTVFENVKPQNILATKEIFGPVIALMKAESIDDAISFINSSNYGNTTSIFTSSGSAARYFYSKVTPSMVGVNIGVPAPMSFFSFGGSKDSFFGEIKAHGSSSVEFFTEKHTAMTRWFENGDGNSLSPHWGGET